ncbi:MAG: Rrf2 family transcriptional regulator, partial [Candidatus Binataceae bacterium]
MLSHKAKYALKALTVLAEEYGHGPITIIDIAERETVPRKFLELILLE